MPLQFRLADDLNLPQEIDDDEYNRWLAKQRPHCLCGRFARPGRPTQMDYDGEYWYTVHCNRCGEVRIS